MINHITPRVMLMKKSVSGNVFWLIGIGLLVFVVYKNISPFGEEVCYRRNSINLERHISELKPTNRIEHITVRGKKYQGLVDDIAYFDLQLNRNYQEAVVKIRYKNEDDRDFQIGMRDRTEWHYQVKPLNSKMINNLKWANTSDNGLILFQKHKKYQSVNDFFENPPRSAVIGTYYYEPPLVNLKPSIASKSNIITINQSLRGAHMIYLLINNSALDLFIEKQDLNWYEGKDPLSIEIYKDSRMILCKNIADDGNTSDSRDLGPVAKAQISLKGREFEGNGIYEIKLVTNDDVLIRKIRADARFLVFERELFLAENMLYTDETSKPTHVSTDAKIVWLKTLHGVGLQQVDFEDKMPLRVTEVNKNYTKRLHNVLNIIAIPQNDLLISGSGYFSFSDDTFFKPKVFSSFPIGKLLESKDSDYVIADYSFSKKNREWVTSKQEFTLSQANVQNGQVSFILSAPGLKRDNARIIIDYIEVTLRREGIL